MTVNYSIDGSQPAVYLTGHHLRATINLRLPPEPLILRLPKTKFGDFLELLRPPGATKADAARAAHVSPQAYTKWAKNEVVPRADRLAAALAFFGYEVRVVPMQRTPETLTKQLAEGADPENLADLLSAAETELDRFSPALHEVGKLRDEVAALRQRLSELEAKSEAAAASPPHANRQ